MVVGDGSDVHLSQFCAVARRQDVRVSKQAHELNKQSVGLSTARTILRDTPTQCATRSASTKGAVILFAPTHEVHSSLKRGRKGVKG